MLLSAFLWPYAFTLLVVGAILDHGKPRRRRPRRSWTSAAFVGGAPAPRVTGFLVQAAGWFTPALLAAGAVGLASAGGLA